jgi:hypothetical protein
LKADLKQLHHFEAGWEAANLEGAGAWFVLSLMLAGPFGTFGAPKVQTRFNAIVLDLK